MLRSNRNNRPRATFTVLVEIDLVRRRFRVVGLGVRRGEAEIGTAILGRALARGHHRRVAARGTETGTVPEIVRETVVVAVAVVVTDGNMIWPTRTTTEATTGEVTTGKVGTALTGDHVNDAQ